MGTLLMQFVAPMQSWGTQSRFEVRDTGREPSKSGVVGLLCAALGRPREASVADLTALQMGVRIDREGVIMREFQTAGRDGFLRASGKVERKQVVVSRRYYLADAAFLVGVHGENGLLSRLQQALQRPQWPLFLGRKSFVPGRPIWLPEGHLPDVSLEAALKGHPWLGSDPLQPDVAHYRWFQPQENASLRMVFDDPDGEEVRHDVPLSFAERTFAARRVRRDWCVLADGSSRGLTDHNEREERG